MAQSFLSKVWHYSKIAVTVYVLFVALLFFMQRKMIYFPDKRRPAVPANAETVAVKTQDGLDLQGWYFPPKDTRPVIVFFHGNAANISLRMVKVDEYLAAGYGVLLAEYRGYGGNPGSPSEAGFYLDGQAYMDWLAAKSVGPERTILYGESIGGGVAVEMTARLSRKGIKVMALVLEVPFTSLLDMAKKDYFFVPVDYLLKDRFMNDEKIGSIKNVPLLIINAEGDEIIPYQQGQRLFALANEPKKYIKITAGDHNNLHRNGLQTHVLDFLAGIPSGDLDNRESGVSQE